MKKLRWLGLSVLCGGLLTACETTSDEPAFSTVPALTLEAVSATELTAFTDSLVLTIGYQDGDGDLGSSDPDERLITVRDSRLSEADTYYLPPLAPEGTAVSIRGEIDFVLPPFFVLGNADRETVDLTLTFTDRAGQVSNALQTTITVVRQ